MRYLVISDIHSNLAALDAVLEDAPSGLAVWCLGDIVGYGPNPNECIERLRSLNPECIVGNHDWAVLGRASLEDFNAEARMAVRWTQEQLTSENLAYLEDLPVSLVRGEFTLVHGSPREPIWEYLIYASSAGLNFAHFSTPYCFVGHTHIPVLFRFWGQGGKRICEAERLWEANTRPLGKERLIINPGSVGQPRDGDPRASYVILDTDERTLEYHRVPYDISHTQHLMREADLPLRLSERLAYGW